MIIYPAALLGSASPPLYYPRIGWQTWLRDLLPAAITVSDDAPGQPKDAPLRPDTAEYWQPQSMPATWTADLGQLRDIDYVGIAAHSIGSSGATLEVRVSDSTDFDARVTMPGIAANHASSPDSVASRVTGDIDIVARVALTDWTPPALNAVFAKRNGAAAAASSYVFGVNSGTGTLLLFWSDGTAQFTVNSTAAPIVTDGAALWIRVTLDVNNGAAGNDVKFYTGTGATVGAVVWTQLGTTVTTAGVTSIRAGTDSLEIGSQVNNTASYLNGAVYYVEVRSGLAGPAVVKFDPASGTNGGTSFVSSTGETWTINRSGVTPARLVQPRFSSALMPADDAPILLLDTVRSARYVQVRLTGATPPQIAVIYAGVILAMQNDLTVPGFTPLTLARETVLHQSLSRGGQFLGQSMRRMGVSGSVEFKYIDPDWLRATFDPFVKSARLYPYFFGWWPDHYASEVGFVWTDKDIRPDYMGFIDAALQARMQVKWNMSGIGNE